MTDNADAVRDLSDADLNALFAKCLGKFYEHSAATIREGPDRENMATLKVVKAEMARRRAEHSDERG